MRAGRSLLFATALVAAFAAHDVARAGDALRAIDAIENDLVADNPAVRAKAAAELTDRFPDGAVAVPMLVDLLDDESPDVVSAAVPTAGYDPPPEKLKPRQDGERKWPT